MQVSIKRLVIDSFKPRETTIVDLSEALANSKGVDEVDIVVTEVDAGTETIKLTIRRSDIDYEAVMKVMKDPRATIRSADEVSAEVKGFAGKELACSLLLLRRADVGVQVLDNFQRFEGGAS